MEINVTRTLCVLLVCAIITFASRVLPFLIFRNKQVPGLVTYLGKVLPMAIMCVLVFYCVRSVSFQSPGGYLPEVLALAVTAAIHLWRKNTFLSIFCGTACYMLLLHFIP